MNPNTTNPCLLCGSMNVKNIDSLSGLEIRTLWKSLNTNLTEHAYGIIRPESVISLFQCKECGFKQYDSTLAGNAEFYEELMANRPYPSITPEFKFALEFARRNHVKSLIDVGGGEGAFLDLARNIGIHTFGVELNRNAAAASAAKGHKMLTKPLEELHPEDIGNQVDMLTLFQVVEHVPKPVEFVAEAAKLVKPGGYVVVAVPNENRMMGLLNLDPANWPPHHISRWRQIDLSRLADRIGFKVAEKGKDPLTGQGLAWALVTHKLLANAAGRPSLPTSQNIARGLGLLYRLCGFKHTSLFGGLSIYAVFQKPLS